MLIVHPVVPGNYPGGNQLSSITIKRSKKLQVFLASFRKKIFCSLLSMATCLFNGLLTNQVTKGAMSQSIRIGPAINSFAGEYINNHVKTARAIAGSIHMA